MADQLKAGDVVRLMSGGPKMTVEQVGRTGMSGGGTLSAWCVWFDGTKRETAVFAVETLEVV